MPIAFGQLIIRYKNGKSSVRRLARIGQLTKQRVGGGSWLDGEAVDEVVDINR